ncbi:MAG: lysylphosphatidylglycerol synthase transmembrane domain-containing protein, partial [Planctomycetota bacterium]
MSSETSATSSPRRLLRFLQPLIGVALLAFVAWLVPWRDELVVKVEGQANVEVPGAIDGDWKGDAVSFEVGESTLSELPTGVSADGALSLTRLEDGTWTREGLTLDEGVQWELTPGMPRLLSTVDPLGMLWALLACFTAVLCGITRWWRLLRLAGCDVRWFDSFRLTYIGLFFNYVLPAGLTGGDLVKAVLAVRENPGKRADALVSVVVDRLLGLFALAVLATVVIFARGETFAELRLPVLAVALAMGGGGFVYINRPLRRLIGFDALIAKLPLGQKFAELDRAVMLYSSKPLEMVLAFALSLGN